MRKRADRAPTSHRVAKDPELLKHLKVKMVSNIHRGWPRYRPSRVCLVPCNFKHTPPRQLGGEGSGDHHTELDDKRVHRCTACLGLNFNEQARRYAVGDVL